MGCKQSEGILSAKSNPKEFYRNNPHPTPPSVLAHTFETYATYVNKELPEYFEIMNQAGLLMIG